MTTAGPAAARPLYLGLDSSTQSLSAVVLEADGNRHRVVLETSLAFDDALPQYGTRHGVLPAEAPHLAVSSPLMWAEALDLMMERLATSGLDMGRLASISGAAQQHGSVYLNAGAAAALATLDPSRGLPEQVAPLLSRPVAPIWLDSSTTTECLDIARAVGGQAELARHTGSRAFERFTGPQIRKFWARDPAGYAATDRIHLVSSFLASLLIGGHAPLDPGDASGMNLMDLATTAWWQPAVEATAPGLEAKLPRLVPAATVAGHVSPRWRMRHGLPQARVVVWSGDNPSSLVGVGLGREGRIGISLGTSDTIFGAMRTPRVDPDGTGHVFGAPTGDFMGLTCFSNGSLARDRVRVAAGLTWAGFSETLSATPPGNRGRLMLPWFVPEITPPVGAPHVHRLGLAEHDVPGNVRAVVEAQMVSMVRHSQWMGVTVESIHATGGASVNLPLLQVMADAFGVEVRSQDISNAAALGAALRARHADRLAQGHRPTWDEILDGLEQAPHHTVRPEAAAHAVYRDVAHRQAEFESNALRTDERHRPAPV
jgi:xylulokinase